VELIAGPGPAGSRGEIVLALRFRLDPGWHLYWRNPGDSGGPPTVTWRLPAGWTAASFEWPVPERFQLGPIVNYGHTGEVTLPVRVTGVPPRGVPATVTGELRWLVCEEICVPGRGTVSITWPLPPGEAREAASWARAIADARARLPRSWPASWGAQARRVGQTLELRLDPPQSLGRPTVFPVDPGLVKDAAPQIVEASGRAVTVRLTLSDEAPRAITRFRAVVALPAGPAYEVDLPVSSPATPTSKPRS
jgi:thiol:disulfide interchange protein DsbD